LSRGVVAEAIDDAKLSSSLACGLKKIGSFAPRISVARYNKPVGTNHRVSDQRVDTDLLTGGRRELGGKLDQLTPNAVFNPKRVHLSSHVNVNHGDRVCGRWFLGNGHAGIAIG